MDSFILYLQSTSKCQLVQTTINFPMNVASYMAFYFHFCPHRVARVVFVKTYVSPLEKCFSNGSHLTERKKKSLKFTASSFKNCPFILTFFISSFISSLLVTFWVSQLDANRPCYCYGKDQKFLSFYVYCHIPSSQNSAWDIVNASKYLLIIE